MINRTKGQRAIIAIFLILILANLVLHTQSNTIFDLVILVWAVFFVYLLKTMKNNIAHLSFMISFYVFLLGREVLFEYFNFDKYYLFSNKINNHTYFSLLLSLIGLIVGMLFYSFTKRSTKLKINTEDKFTNLRNTSKRVFYILFIPYIIELGYNIVSVQSIGYIASYQAKNIVQVPTIINIFGGMAPMALYIFLATKPTKAEALPSIAMYAIYNFLTIFTGKRYPVVAAFMFLAIYYVIRERNQENWINKKHVIILLVSIPLMLIGLSIYDYVRSGNQYTSRNATYIFIDFFDQLGGSINVIKREKYFSAYLSNVQLYSLHGIRTLLFENGFMTRLFGVTTYTGNSIAHALNGHSLAHTLSYYTYGTGYLAGKGGGSSFIAELFHDFWYIGVFLGSTLYGWILKRISMIDFSKPYVTAILLSMIHSLLLAPRGGFDEFISTAFGVRPMLILFFIIVYTHLIKSLKK